MNKVNTRSMVLTAVMAAVMCILGPLSVPIGPVPISLAIFGVYLAVYVLGMKRGTVAVLIYLLIGLIGVPVFAGFTAGPQKLLGPTGGYLIGYILLALIAGLFIDRFDHSVPMQVIGMLIGLVVCYALGTGWLMVSAHMGFAAAMMAGVVPFIPFDVAKLVIAILVGRPLRRRLGRFVRA